LTSFLIFIFISKVLILKVFIFAYFCFWAREGKNVIRGKIKRDNEKKEAISQKQKQIINANTELKEARSDRL